MDIATEQKNETERQELSLLEEEKLPSLISTGINDLVQKGMEWPLDEELFAKYIHSTTPVAIQENEAPPRNDKTDDRHDDIVDSLVHYFQDGFFDGSAG